MSVDPTTALPSRPSPGAAGAQLGRLYADHSRMVYGVCRMLLRDPDEAEDATQQVFLAAYRNLLTGTDVRDPAAWLGTIARNACRRRAAVRMREPLAVAGDELTLVSPGVEETAIGREDAAELYAELGRLPGKQREAVVLRDLYGLRYDEVAKALGTSRPAVEALLFRGRRRLKRRLRPGVAAGVLVVPLAVQESIAYAIPGFASTAAPAGAAAAAAGIPLLAKLAAGGAAIGIAGSAGVVAERGLHDPPSRPADVREIRAQAPVQRPELSVARTPPVVNGVVSSSAVVSDRSTRGERSDAEERGDAGGENRGPGGSGDDDGPARAAGGVSGDDEPEHESAPRAAEPEPEHEPEPLESRKREDATESSGSDESSSSPRSDSSGGDESGHDVPEEPDRHDEPEDGG